MQESSPRSHRISTPPMKTPHRMPCALTIAGSDSSGGAGVQADLKTMTSLGVFGMSVITAVTAQNTRGVQGVWPLPRAAVRSQMESVLRDIPPDAIKIGMLADAALIEEVARGIQGMKGTAVVLDPVMVSTSGSSLLSRDAHQALKETLLPLATILTPNHFEAEVLLGERIASKGAIEAAARSIQSLGCPYVLMKGGHFGQDADDFLQGPEGGLWIYGRRLENPNTHGTGCTLSSAIASFLAKGSSLEEAVVSAKEYLTRLIADRLDLGAGRGPLNHGA
ncbi:Hydroxymethylpyrimidine phosphate kinase ThiD [Clostridiaceae bacterium JG1575]|nr:Hydroxymethylpyrimidine phosphate kinase ThiD [Clostridiaceae bacterium JG1575]